MPSCAGPLPQCPNLGDASGLARKPVFKKHDRKSFDCGGAELNDFLHRYPRQSHDLGGAKTFLAIDNTDNKTILGFYSLAPGEVVYADTPQIFCRGLAQHDVPGFRLARIATHVNVHWRRMAQFH